MPDIDIEDGDMTHDDVIALLIRRLLVATRYV